MKTLRYALIHSALVAIAAFLLAAGAPAHAQEASSGISGTVTDNSHSAIPNATVTAQNTRTGVKNTTRSNGTGYYDFPVLPAGEYTVTVTAAGFTATKSNPFTIETGLPARIDLPLKVGSVDVTVDVSAAQTLVNTTTNELGVTVDPVEMENLPVENRNLFDLIAIQPGVNSSQSGDADSTAQNARGGFEVNGAPGLSNSILLDGVDATFGEDNGAGAGNQVAINTIGLGSIAEFRTSSSVPPVQYGRAVGGILTITTKSGTNKIHGQVFEYFRNDVMDANTWQNIRSKQPVPELRFNEFGGNIGGPLRHDKLFYFASYEGSRVVQGNSTTTSQIPSPFLIQKMASQTTTPNYMQIVQELQLMPLPNDPPIPYNPANPSVNSGTHGTFTGNLTNYTVEDTGLGRIDYSLGKHHLTVRSNVNNQAEYEQQIRPDNQLIYPLRLYNAVVSDAWTLRSNLVNEFRLGLNRNDLARHNTSYDSDPFKNYIVITGVAETDTAESKLHFLTTTYTLVDNLTWVHGRHVFTIGTDDRDLRSARYQDTNTTTTYANTTAMYTNKPTSVNVYFSHPGHFVSYQWSAFAQDSFRATNRLTLNYGVRYEYYTPLRGAFNIRGSDPFGAMDTNKWDPFFTEDKYNFAPRLGFIYDLLGNQKLVFRSGFGLMFLPPQPFLLYNSAFLDPNLPSQENNVTTADIRGANTNLLQYPLSKTVINGWAADPSTLAIAPARYVSNYHHPDQYSINWNAQLQYQAFRDVFFALTYTALRDQHSPTMTLPNQFAAGSCPITTAVLAGGTCGPRPNPNFGEIDENIYDGREYYDGMYAQVTYRHGMNRANFYYTYASGISYWASNNNIGTGQSDIQDLAHPELSRGQSTGSARNRIAASYTIAPPIPGFARSHAALRQTFGGWSLQSIVKYNSGTVRNVVTAADLVRNGRTAGTRPDRVPGQPLYSRHPNADGTYQWLNPAAFDYKTPFAQQRYGNLGWNAVFGPINFNWNASVIKTVRLSGAKQFRFRAEAFNVINHSNLGSPALTVTTTSTFGEITTRRTPRNLQLGAEFVF